MYNRYIPGTDGYTRVAVDDGPKGGGRQEHSQRSPRQTTASRDRRRGAAGRLPFLSGEDKNAGIAGILKALHLEDLDSGDLLLLLIILFLFLEGDDLEPVITLGLMLLLSLGDEKQNQKE